tara:strand:+ start:189 stop:362 length:174 start_codon:yes stop_codon:yes gene_type:complete
MGIAYAAILLMAVAPIYVGSYWSLQLSVVNTNERNEVVFLSQVRLVESSLFSYQIYL